LPFQGGRLPGIIRIGWLPFLHAPKEIDDERNLRQAEKPRGVRHSFVGLQDRSGQSDFAVGAGVDLAAVIHPPQHAGHPLREHGHKDRIHEKQGSPKMNFTKGFIHHSPGNLRIPKIDSGE